MFRSSWTILRELMLSLAKATILWNWSVKIHRYMICGVVATSISGCDECTACRIVCDSHTTRHSVHRRMDQHDEANTRFALLLERTQKPFRSFYSSLKQSRYKLVRNVMAHAQKPDFVFPRNGRVHLNRWGTSVQSTAGGRGVRISLSNAG